MACVELVRRTDAVTRFALSPFTRRVALAASVAASVAAFAMAVAPATLAADCPAAGPVKAAAASFMSAARAKSPGAFSAALSRHADVTSLALFALGPYRKDLPAARRAQYVRSAQGFMGAFLADNAKRFGSASLSIETCRGNLVETTASGRDIVWRVSGSRIQDVRVGGVWLAPQLRSKFVGVIRRGDGNIDALFDYLSHRRVAAN
jgi:phospholipid transport system substrate-binding protein